MQRQRRTDAGAQFQQDDAGENEEGPVAGDGVHDKGRGDAGHWSGHQRDEASSTSRADKELRGQAGEARRSGGLRRRRRTVGERARWRGRSDDRRFQALMVAITNVKSAISVLLK